MKEVGKILESRFEKEGKYYLLLAVFAYFLNVLQYGSQIKEMANEQFPAFTVLNFSMTGHILLILLLFFTLQIRSMLKLQKAGKTRMLLLPIHKMKLFYAHFIFVFATLCLQAAAFSLSYISFYLLQRTILPAYENMFVYFIGAQPMAQWFLPRNGSQLLAIFAVLCSISVLFCVYAQARFSSALTTKLVITVFIFLIPMIVVSSYALDLGLPMIVNTLLLALLAALHFYLLWSTIGRGKVGE